MRLVLLPVFLIVAFAASSYALPIKTAEYGTVTPRDYSPAQDYCPLNYYNFCSGWVYYWTFAGNGGAKVGVCFDLDDCCGYDLCHDLRIGYWAFKRFSFWGMADFEVYCADKNCCPVGEPIAGAYDVWINQLWTAVDFTGVSLEVCDIPGCDRSRFIYMVTIQYPDEAAPYSDGDNLNWDRGCGTTWTCVPHSFIYLAYDTQDSVWVDYCAETGYPGHMFYADSRSQCQTQFGLGFYHNWLVDFYVECSISTATEQHSWSEIKALYK